MHRLDRIPLEFRKLLDRLRERPGLVLGLSLGGLLVVIAITGAAGLAINQNVADTTDRTIEHDIELEDEGDDMRAAILDLRHFHRDVFFEGSTLDTRTNFSDAYMELHDQISDYAEIEESPGVLTADELEAMARDYHTVFYPAIDLYDTDREEFNDASDQGLEMLQVMEEAAREIEQLGEDQAETSLANVDQANQQARFILIGVLAGVVLIGIGLVWSAVRVVAQIRGLYTAQQASAARLADAVKAKTDFIADASHELRTPLTVLRGNAEAGLAIDKDCVHREILEDIVSESVRMTRLVEDLLFLARSDSDSLPLRADPIAAEGLALSLAERARMLVQEKGHTLGTALAGHGTIRVDVTRIEQAVMVLVDNAAKYSPPNSTVGLNTSTWKDEFIFEVVDRGAGMSSEELGLIFDRFYRVDKARSRRLGGAGLGLAIAKTIVEAHGGRMEVESHVNDGTKMRVHLPLLKKGELAAAIPPETGTLAPLAATAGTGFRGDDGQYQSS